MVLVLTCVWQWYDANLTAVEVVVISSHGSNENSAASAERPQIQVNVIFRQIAPLTYLTGGVVVVMKILQPHKDCRNDVHRVCRLACKRRRLMLNRRSSAPPAKFVLLQGQLLSTLASLSHTEWLKRLASADTVSQLLQGWTCWIFRDSVRCNLTVTGGHLTVTFAFHGLQPVCQTLTLTRINPLLETI